MDLCPRVCFSLSVSAGRAILFFGGACSVEKSLFSVLGDAGTGGAAVCRGEAGAGAAEISGICGFWGLEGGRGFLSRNALNISSSVYSSRGITVSCGRVAEGYSSP